MVRHCSIRCSSTCHIFCVSCSACSATVDVGRYVVYLFAIFVSYCRSRCRSGIRTKDNPILREPTLSIGLKARPSDAAVDQSHLENDSGDRGTSLGKAWGLDASLLKVGVPFAQIEVESALNAHTLEGHSAGVRLIPVHAFPECPDMLRLCSLLSAAHAGQWQHNAPVLVVHTNSVTAMEAQAEVTHSILDLAEIAPLVMGFRKSFACGMPIADTVIARS